jgi:hypothetical protein
MANGELPVWTRIGMKMRGCVEEMGTELRKVEKLSAAGTPDPVILFLIQLSHDPRQVPSFPLPEQDLALRQSHTTSAAVAEF